MWRTCASSWNTFPRRCWHQLILYHGFNHQLWFWPTHSSETQSLKAFASWEEAMKNSCSYCFAGRWSHTRLKMTQISTACPLFDEYDAQFKWEVSWQGQFWQHAQFSEIFPIWRSMLCRWVAQSRTSMITYSSSLWISCRNPYLPAKL